MTMKTGQGSDPFSDDEETNDEDTTNTTTTTESETTADATATDTSGHKYPYVLRRDRVKDERTNEHVALLRDEFSELESEIETDVAEEIGISETDLSVFDLREALYQLGHEHPERLAEILLEWGYDAKVD